MSPANRHTTEAELLIKARCREGDHVLAFDLALSTYEAELLSFLRAFTPDLDLAREVYSELSENLWRSLPDFRWECSFRTWAYMLARQASLRHRRERLRREKLCSESDLSEVPYQGRSSTQPWLQTGIKARFRRLRTRLSIDEQQILLLRVDREMSWIDVARVMDGTDPVGGLDLTARTAALRQRFHAIKERLRALAMEEGLISSVSQ
jgi:RNA polymerase sigma-70 factor, ECF subfamily